jgi:hypothetical protein
VSQATTIDAALDMVLNGVASEPFAESLPDGDT